MNRMESVLLSILCLACRCERAGGMVSYAPPSDLLATALGSLGLELPLGIVDESNIAQRNAPFSAAALASAASLLAWATEPVDHSPALEKRLDQVGDDLDTLWALLLASESHVLQRATVQIQRLTVFDYLTTLALEPQPGEPAVVLVGHVPPGLDQLTVKIPGRQRQLRNVTLVYTGGRLYPRLDISLPSRDVASGLHINRKGWMQYLGEDARLELYSHNLRPLGQVVTECTPLPYELVWNRLRVCIPCETGARLLTTRVTDSAGHDLARIVKVDRDASDT